jgi:hypothetical protein
MVIGGALHPSMVNHEIIATSKSDFFGLVLDMATPAFGSWYFSDSYLERPTLKLSCERVQ